MAIEYYSSIDLNKNELQNAVVQNLGSAPGSPVEGQIYYDTGDDTIYFRNASAWVSIGGDITGVTAGDGLTGGGTSGAVTLNVVGGDGITANANDVAITAAQTTITSVVNTSLEIGRDAHNRIKFGTDDQIIFEVNNNDGVIFKASGEIEAGSLDISGNADIDGTLETDALTIAGTNLLTGAVTFSGNTIFSGTPNVSGTLTVAGDIQHTGDTNNKIAFGTDTQAFETGGSTRMNISDSGFQIGASGARVTTIEDNDSLGTSDTKLATQGNVKAYVDGQTYDDVSVANLKTRLAGGFGSNAVTIGDSNDVVTIGNDLIITGDLTVSGDTVSANVATLDVEDKNITLNKGSGDTSSTADGAGITIQDAVNSDTDATLLWNAANDKFVFSHLIEAPGTSIFTNLDISGNVDVDGTLETDALTIGGSAVLAQATTSAVGAVELATSAETQTGTDTARAVTPDGLAARSVVADIDVSSLTDANIVTITHNLGTADILVQVYDKTTEANIMCDIARTTDDFSTASTSVVSIDFGTAPPNDCRALITSLKGATASGTVAYT
jgi:hypothetical protein